MLGARAVHRLLLAVEVLASDAVQAGVMLFVDVVGIRPRPQLSGSADVQVPAGPDEFVVRDIESRE